MEAKTSFQASVTLACLDNKKINIDVTKGTNLKDLVYHLVQLHALPPYTTVSLYSILLSAMQETCEKELIETQVNNTSKKQELRHLFMDAYQSNTLQYNNKPEEDIFPRAYHTLVHCPISAIFDTLLELEQSYAIAIQELQTASDHELVAIQARQAQEIENSSNNNSTNGSPNPQQPGSPPTSTISTTSSTANNNMTTIFTRQVEEMEIFQATWQSDIMQTQQTQRQEYREFVIELYREYQSRLASLSSEEKEDNTSVVAAEKKLDGKEIVAAAASRVKQWDQPNAGGSSSVTSGTSGSSKSNNTNPIITRRRTGSLASSLGSIQSPNLQQQQHSPNELASLVRSNNTATEPVVQDTTKSVEFQNIVKNIQEMGFAKEQAEAALALTTNQNNMEAAIGLLLENPTKVDAYIAEQKLQQQQAQQQEKFNQMPRPPASSSTPYRRSHSLSQVQHPTSLTSASSPTLPVVPASSSSSSASKTSTKEESNRRHSLQRFSTTPTFLNIMSKGNPASSSSSPNPANSTSSTSIPQTAQVGQAQGKSWNPISFLQQQKQAMENTNLSSVRKLGGWLSKAMENFGIDHDEENNGRLPYQQHQHQVQQQKPQLVESFTIMMGTTQIKSSHNLRLLVTDEATEIFHPFYDPPREMAYRAETATKLYTSNLTAAIVLVEVNELTRKKKSGWRQYKSGKGSNKALFERCQQSTEFHFSDIESQISVIEQDFVEHNAESESIREGSFFVTKHSNLPSTQVVFHLMIDSSAMMATDLSNRHPLIIGLRNILKMTTQFDISSLSIPLLLLPDRFMSIQQKQQQRGDSSIWLQKRGEVVMKCIKGFLIENSRSGKRVQNEGLDRAESMGGGGMRNIEFLLPCQPEIYKSSAIAAVAKENMIPLTPSTPILSSSSATATPTSAGGLNGANNGLATGGEMMTGAAPQEVEIAFQQFRTLLVNLFRTS